jgi:hypothetical protein
MKRRPGSAGSQHHKRMADQQLCWKAAEVLS